MSVFNDHGIYPLTIVKDRFHGTYSGGLWLAFMVDPDDLSDEDAGGLFGGDCGQMNYWRDGKGWWVGRGDDPQSAVDDLKRRYIEKYGHCQGSTS